MVEGSGDDDKEDDNEEGEDGDSGFDEADECEQALAELESIDDELDEILGLEMGGDDYMRMEQWEMQVRFKEKDIFGQT